ncbi:Aspartyl/glutamyl-tRNA(Asn/Gln) amidotransferase subunit B putative isoform 2 [Tripterygium wilfordii]|uniref:Aspartyl/glutamyl-tRNA(Asn/Gln) amidotransferase subunit B putative isoform 2 n=2 Tax=Tripterygium wilfordii TaxID=458696 RepID=A0A7J7DCH7_TRIWF|nr:Aspartyl/glutamyl-tRNA(Asn/Gln) amidotransferase subunit B putative isoform 2 [Tripterygium wilfordii]
MGIFLSCFRHRDSRRRRGGVSGSDSASARSKYTAKFLKVCDTLSGTPTEIRKASKQLKGSSHCHRDSEPLEFRSWLPNSSIQKL